MDYLEVVHVLIRRPHSSRQVVYKAWETHWRDHSAIGLERFYRPGYNYAKAEVKTATSDRSSVSGWATHLAARVRILIAHIGYAQSEDELRTSASDAFGEYYARGLNIAEGLIENDVTLMVFSAKTFELVRGLDGKASIRCHGFVSFNGS